VVKGQGLYFFEEPVPADDIVPSPDGQWVLAHVMNQLYVIAMPVVGGEPPTVNVTSPAVPAKRLTDIGADYFAWADGGKTITWAVGASLFREPLSAISFEPPKDEKKEGRRRTTTRKRLTPRMRTRKTPPRKQPTPRKMTRRKRKKKKRN